MVTLNKSIDEALIIHLRIIETMKGPSFWLADKERRFMVEAIKCVSAGLPLRSKQTKQLMEPAGFNHALYYTYQGLLLDSGWIINNGFKLENNKSVKDVKLAPFVLAGMPKDNKGNLMLPDAIRYDFEVKVN